MRQKKMKAKAKVKAQHDEDLASRRGEAQLPNALAVKYPRVPFEWDWQYVFQRPGFQPIQGAGGCVGIIFLKRAYKKSNQEGFARSRHSKACGAAHAEAFIRNSFA